MQKGTGSRREGEGGGICTCKGMLCACTGVGAQVRMQGGAVASKWTRTAPRLLRRSEGGACGEGGAASHAVRSERDRARREVAGGPGGRRGRRRRRGGSPASESPESGTAGARRGRAGVRLAISAAGPAAGTAAALAAAAAAADSAGAWRSCHPRGRRRRRRTLPPPPRARRGLYSRAQQEIVPAGRRAMRAGAWGRPTWPGALQLRSSPAMAQGRLLG